MSGIFIAEDLNLKVIINPRHIRHILAPLFGQNMNQHFTLQDSKDLLLALKHIPVDEAKYIHTRFIKGKGIYLTEKETMKQLNLNYSQANKLRQRAFRSLADAILAIKIENSKHTVTNEIRKEFILDLEEYKNNLVMREYDKVLRSVEVIKRLYGHIYLISITWEKWERIKE